MHLFTLLTNLFVLLIAVSSAGLDIDLNELPPEDIDPNKTLTNLGNKPAENSLSMLSSRKQSTLILGKRKRKMRPTNKENEVKRSKKAEKLSKDQVSEGYGYLSGGKSTNRREICSE